MVLIQEDHVIPTFTSRASLGAEPLQFLGVSLRARPSSGLKCLILCLALFQKWCHLLIPNLITTDTVKGPLRWIL